MFNEIKTWLLRKGIWFLLILSGLITFSILQPEWAVFRDVAAVQKNAPEQLAKWRDESTNAVEIAKTESLQFIDKKIVEESSKIDSLNTKIKSLEGFSTNPRVAIKNNVYKEIYGMERSWADWRKRQYEQIKSELERTQTDKEITAKLQERNGIYTQKYWEYQPMPSGKEADDAHDYLVALHNEIQNLQSQLNAINNRPKIQAIQLPDLSTSKIDAERAKLDDESLSQQVFQSAADNWPYALLAVIIGIFLSPLSRFICYYCLAPLSSKQPPILLEPNSGTTNETKGCSKSGTNIELGLEPNEILLVHHDYAKAIPTNCRAGTQILLDNASPFTSLASGLYNLVRISPIETTSVDISSGHDGLNELMSITLEADESIVIEPRNIVGIVVRQGKLIKLRKHWVFNKLQPWLKWQFRYLTISGPLTLVLKGGRGLVASQLHSELLIEPEYVVAFSSCIGYGTSRTETFGGYYSRKKSLLKDHFIGSHGFVIHQEANLDSNMSSKKSGLEGVVDGLLKALGI